VKLWRRIEVSQLERAGILRVEDGNHGEYRPRRHEFSKTGVAFVRAADIAGGAINFEQTEKINSLARARIRKGIGAPGDVLLSHKGTVGRVALVPLQCPEFVCSPQTTFWRSRDMARLDRRYLRFFLESPDFRRQLASRKGETDMADYVSLTEQRRLSVLMPPISVQRAIGGALAALDDKLAANRQLTGTLDGLVGAIYQLQTWGIGLSPLSDSLTVEMGAPFSGSSFAVPGIGRPLIRIRDFSTFDPGVWTTETRLDEKVIEAGDVVVGMDAEFRSRLWLGRPGVLNQRVCHFVPRDGVARAFALHSIRPDLAFFEAVKSGTTIIHLNKADIDRFRVPGLSVRQHRVLTELTDPLIDRTIAIARESRSLQGVRDLLLPALMAGRLAPQPAQSVLGAP
jgi:type I restriction enzyme S subunit